MKSFYEFVNNKEENLDEGLMGNIANGAVAAGKHIIGGIKAGGESLLNSINGPQAKFDNAISAINGLIASLNQNPVLQNLQGPNNTPLVKELTNLMVSLNKRKQMIPTMMAQIAKNNWQQQPQQVNQSSNVPPPLPGQQSS